LITTVGIAQIIDSCSVWKSFINVKGDDSNISIKFCDLDESKNAHFYIKNDNKLDTKLIY
jgi:hypothetical protein